MSKVDWIIHYVSEKACDVCGKKGNAQDNMVYDGFPDFGNIHTHGLIEYNHRELCIALGLDAQTAMTLLNSMGMRIANGETVFTEGIRSDVLQGEYDCKFITFKDDPTLYVILPDAQNRFPGMDGCESPYCFQETYAKIISDGKGYV